MQSTQTRVFSTGFLASARQGFQIPAWSDPRWAFGSLLLIYAILGCTVLGFNRNIWQIGLTTSAACLIEVALAFFVRRQLIFPLSAFISSLSLSLILNYAHGYLLLLIPVALTIGSKYLFTFEGKHVYNPSLFGVAISLMLGNEWITAAPAYQWGGSAALSAFLVMAAFTLFISRVGKAPLVIAFLCFYTLQTALRAYIMRWHLPPETLFLGTLTSAPFFLFTFYMMTDPATSPKTARGQVIFAFVLTVVDLYLHKMESVFTFFYAAFLMATGKFLFLHARAWYREGFARCRRVFAFERLRAVAAASGTIGLAVALNGFALHPAQSTKPVSFHLRALSPDESGIHTEMGAVFDQVDPRIQHVGKWLLSVGDAVAVGDYDGDGFIDLFLTNPLKRPVDRNALYRNVGGMRFERVKMPALAPRSPDPGADGLAASAMFVDYDNDGDADLFLAYGYGESRLFRNLLNESGKPGFEETTRFAGLKGHTISLTANVLDFDRDGRLDLIQGNAVHPYLPGYDTPTPLNIFKLPKPAYPGDRRMFNFMHNGWHNADNGAQKEFYRNMGGGRFEKLDAGKLGMPETHWTLAIGTGDLNHDGFTDLYCASDFGPDDLYLNRGGKGFERISGKTFSDVGRDTYKGMNVTLADFDRNGYLDGYVSDVHHALQAEGSLLWMTRPGTDSRYPSFTDEAMKRGVLNERRFGWGAGAGDLDNDGWLDIVQANGMVDDRLDRRFGDDERKDYWYVNHKLMQAGPEIHTYADKWGDLRGRTIYPNEARRVYLNQGAREAGQFVDVAQQAGMRELDNSRGVALADFDNDGRLDLVVTNLHGPVSIYRNEAVPVLPQSHWLGLALVGDGRHTATQPVGSQVTVQFNDHRERASQMQEVQAINGMAGQGDPRLHFGLGEDPGLVDVTVTWYGTGKQTTYRGLKPDRYYRLKEGAPEAALLVLPAQPVRMAASSRE